MKEKIELSQADLIVVLVEKIKILRTEYVSLHDAFTYDGKGRTQTDPIKIAESYQRFLSENGDIQRILKLYELFNTTEKNK